MNKKVWLITGISSGLGKSLADAVMNSGDYVIGTFRKKTQVQDFNKLHHGSGFACQLDLTDDASIDHLISTISEKFPRIDVLVNNAGIGFIGAIEETSIEECRTVFETNFFGTLRLTREILPIMRHQKSGHIIQISSHGGIKAFAGFGIYNASKFALEGFSEALAQETESLGIKVSLIEPGPFRTEFASGNLGEAGTTIEDYNDTAGKFRTMLKGVHGSQEGDPNKAAEAIINLARMQHPPLRLPLGKVPLKTIQMKIDSVQKDVDASREIAESVVFV